MRFGISGSASLAVSPIILSDARTSDFPSSQITATQTVILRLPSGRLSALVGIPYHSAPSKGRPCSIVCQWLVATSCLARTQPLALTPQHDRQGFLGDPPGRRRRRQRRVVDHSDH